MTIDKRVEPLRHVMTGLLPGGHSFTLSVSGPVAPRALYHVIKQIALTHQFLEDDEAEENSENNNGDGI